MALKLRKDIKKSLYYVWFLGAKESKGLRGSDYILPVIKHLEQREKDVEPFKVTLQVSHKGLKIIQNVVSQGKSKPKNETIKHFIPHNTITCVYQQEDIIACILLLFNPVTKCPLHVHAYRCDSVETATLLKQQLQTLIESPDNQKKFAEIEGRLNPPKEVKKVESSLGSDTGTSTRESESSEERFGGENVRVTSLYDSVAAELRAKLGKNDVPILLPPRDYDTVHRQKGNLTGIELRRCLNSNIVGQNVKGRRIESSGGSSGIGSDHPPSPDSPDAPDTRFNTLDNQSTSDEDWNGDTTESTLYLMHAPPQMTLPRPVHGREIPPEQVHEEYHQDDRRFARYPEPVPSKTTDEKYHMTRDEKYARSMEHQVNISKYLEKPIAKFSENKYLDRQKSIEKERQMSLEKHKALDNRRSLDRQLSVEKSEKHKSLERQSSRQRDADPSDKYFDSYNNNNKYYYNEINERYIEDDRFEKKGNNRYEEEQRREERRIPAKYFDDDGFDEHIGYRSSSTEFEKANTRYSYDEEEYFKEKPSIYKQPPVPKTRAKYSPEQPHDTEDKRHDRSQYNDSKYVPDNRYQQEIKSRPKSTVEKYNNENKSKFSDSRCFEEDYKSRPRSVNDKFVRQDGDDRDPRQNGSFFEEQINRRSAHYRQRSPSPEDVKVSPKDRFKDAKEKFLSMEKDRVFEQKWDREEVPIKPIHNSNTKPFLKRHESMLNPVKERYEDVFFEDRRNEPTTPKPAPRNTEEVRYRREPPMDRYNRNADKIEPNKRRSMFSSIEEEHRKNSNEIAKELRRRSHLETNNKFEDEVHRDRERERERSFQELPESDRYHSVERDERGYNNFPKSNVDSDKVSDLKYDPRFAKNPKPKSAVVAGYRHSYAEPKLRAERAGKKYYPEMLQRNNSSVSNTGRVGIASIHPY